MKIAFITGGSKGLGKAFATLLAREGFSIYEFSRSGTSPDTVRCDFAKPLEACHNIESIFSQLAHNRLSEILLINNVGSLTPIGPVGNSASAEIIANINVNFVSAVIASGLFARYFQDHPANKAILSISSGAARNGRHGWSLYCSTKAGLEMFAETFGKEQQRETHPIRSILLNPGVMDTEMQTAIRATNSQIFPERQRFVDLKTAGKLADPTLVASFAYSHYQSNRDIFSFIQYTP